MEHRVLLRTTTAKDAIVAVAVFARSGIEAVSCDSVDGLLREMDKGVGAVLLSDEVLRGAALEGLTAWLQGQPAWSDLPILVSARPGVSVEGLGKAFELLSNLTILERPMRIASLVSAARSALRARERQYLLRTHVAALQEQDRRKTEFLATLAHELRNPMAPLTTTLAILRRKAPLPQGMKPYYDMMERQVHFMAKLVDDLMEVSRITRGKIELKPQRLFISSAIGDAIEVSRPAIEARNHVLQVDSIDPMLAVHGDPVRLTQVFSNLLNNAARYTPTGGRIRVSVRTEGPNLTVTVSDSGMGIAPESLPVIFDMFVQVAGTARESQGGLGIGLTLVKSLVELHGGEARAHSAGLGQGSEFSVVLPIAARPVAAAIQEGSAGGDAELDGLEGLAVLIVDDNRDAADSLGDLLLMHGATVTVAYDGLTALNAYRSFTPHVAVLDLGMPGMDGYELAERIQKEPGRRIPTLVALTGWGQPDDRARIEAAGFNLHLVKPVKLAELAGGLRDVERP